MLLGLKRKKDDSKKMNDCREWVSDHPLNEHCTSVPGVEILEQMHGETVAKQMRDIKMLIQDVRPADNLGRVCYCCSPEAHPHQVSH